MIIIAMLTFVAGLTIIAGTKEVPEITVTQGYMTNVFKSEQCSGVAISDMKKLRLGAQTGSMRPYLYAGDIMLTINYDPERKLVLGDVVSNNNKIHRIAVINSFEGNFQMKGDNNLKLDYEWLNFNETEYVVCGVMRGTNDN